MRFSQGSEWGCFARQPALSTVLKKFTKQLLVEDKGQLGYQLGMTSSCGGEGRGNFDFSIEKA